MRKIIVLCTRCIFCIVARALADNQYQVVVRKAHRRRAGGLPRRSVVLGSGGVRVGVRRVPGSFDGTKLVFRGSELVFRGSKIVFRGEAGSYRCTVAAQYPHNEAVLLPLRSASKKNNVPQRPCGRSGLPSRVGLYFYRYVNPLSKTSFQKKVCGCVSSRCGCM